MALGKCSGCRSTMFLSSLGERRPNAWLIVTGARERWRLLRLWLSMAESKSSSWSNGWGASFVGGSGAGDGMRAEGWCTGVEGLEPDSLSDEDSDSVPDWESLEFDDEDSPGKAGGLEGSGAEEKNYTHEAAGRPGLSLCRAK